MSKAPAFQFYPGDWLSSTKITLMTPAEEGGYIHLLAHEWGEDDCGLPDDDIELAVLSRLGKAWGDGSGEKIRRCFFLKDNRLYNDRLLKEKKKQEEWRKKSSEGGIKGAKARWDKGKGMRRGGHKKVTTNPSPSDDLSSSSSSSKNNTFDPDSTEIGLARLFWKLLKERGYEAKKPNGQNWAGVFDKMIRIDKYPPERIEEVMRWVVTDIQVPKPGSTWRGWSKVVLSPGKLRDKWGELVDEMKAKQGNDGQRPAYKTCVHAECAARVPMADNYCPACRRKQ